MAEETERVPVPYLTGRNSSLKLEEAVDILRRPDDTRTIRRPPRTPRGGEVYLYKIEDERQEGKRAPYNLQSIFINTKFLDHPLSIKS